MIFDFVKSSRYFFHALSSSFTLLLNSSVIGISYFSDNYQNDEYEREEKKIELKLKKEQIKWGKKKNKEKESIKQKNVGGVDRALWCGYIVRLWQLL